MIIIVFIRTTDKNSEKKCNKKNIKTAKCIGVCVPFV